MTAMIDRAFIDRLEHVWDSLAAVCGELTQHEWACTTDCPGWTVKDQLAHVTGTESWLAGWSEPEIGHRPDHVHNDLGAFNEAWIQHFRDTSTDVLLAQFADVSAARLKALRAMSDEQLQVPTTSPVGTVAYHQFMAIRVMDCWVHEQDIRNAVARPGGLDTDAAEAATDQLLQTLNYIVGKLVRPPEGTAVAMHLDGPVHRRRVLQIRDGRARVADTAPDVLSEVTTDSATFARLATGRWEPGSVLASGAVRLTGDHRIGRSLIENLATTP